MMTVYERFQEYGRIRSIAKDVDPYSLTIEKDNKLYVILSSKQVIDADKFHLMKDSTIHTWLKLLFDIKMGLRRIA